MIKIYKEITRRFSNLEERALSIESKLIGYAPWEKSYQTYALLSDTWHAWNFFVRNLLIASCCGCKAIDGANILTRSLNNSWQRIGYEARQAGQNKPILPTNKITSLRQEPTWGDHKKIIKVITALKPANANVLITAFGLPIKGPEHLQIVRNSCAHLHKEAAQEVNSISFYYSGKIKHPSDLAWKNDMAKSELAYYCWLEDLRTIAQLATYTA